MPSRSTLLCALALLTGFLMVCLGAFVLSSGSLSSCKENTILAYLLLPLGFLILLSGVFWSTYRQARASKGMFTPMLRWHRHPVQGLAVTPATVDRPDFYPPAYEESLAAAAVKQTSLGWGTAAADAPPLYAEKDLESPDQSATCPEAPPSYEESVDIRTAAAAMPVLDAERRSWED